jgi:hypothetical protein
MKTSIEITLSLDGEDLETDAFRLATALADTGLQPSESTFLLLETLKVLCLANALDLSRLSTERN